MCMKDKTEQNLKIRNITIAFYTGFIFYVLISIIVGIVNGSVISGVSEILFIIMFIVLPIIIIVMPFMLKKAGNENFGDCVKTTLIVSLIYAVVSVGTEFGIREYFMHFSADMWNNYPVNRYLMIDDLEKNHKIIGMSTDEIQNLLGSPAQYDTIQGNKKALIYGGAKKLFTDEYYAVIYDDNNTVTETDTGRTTEVLH